MTRRVIIPLRRCGWPAGGDPVRRTICRGSRAGRRPPDSSRGAGRCGLTDPWSSPWTRRRRDTSWSIRRGPRPSSPDARPQGCLDPPASPSSRRNRRGLGGLHAFTTSKAEARRHARRRTRWRGLRARTLDACDHTTLGVEQARWVQAPQRQGRTRGLPPAGTSTPGGPLRRRPDCEATTTVSAKRVAAISADAGLGGAVHVPCAQQMQRKVPVIRLRRGPFEGLAARVGLVDSDDDGRLVGVRHVPSSRNDGSAALCDCAVGSGLADG